MPRSFRIDPVLERRLCEVARREGVPISAVVREAIEKHCDAVLGTDTAERLSYVIGAVEGSGDAPASRNGEEPTDIIAENHRDAVPRTDSRERLSYVIGAVESDGTDWSSRTGEKFTDLLMEKYLRDQAARDPD
jgi:hypothetical protein